MFQNPCDFNDTNYWLGVGLQTPIKGMKKQDICNMILRDRTNIECHRFFLDFIYGKIYKPPC